jgi:hypothetical protein
MADPKAISNEVAEKIGGGECTLKDAVELSGQLANAYDNLVEFTTYVIERVAGQ